jgi:hypothetical protein
MCRCDAGLRSKKSVLPANCVVVVQETRPPSMATSLMLGKRLFDVNAANGRSSESSGRWHDGRCSIAVVHRW